MNIVIEQMLKKYLLNTEEEYENAIKEIVQHLCLLSLWRSKFYEYAAFYGGSSLHIFYGLNRFSEDLDFSLIKPNPTFKLDQYLQFIKIELKAFGFDFNIEQKRKRYISTIESAFIKGNTIKNLITINADRNIVKHYHKNKKIKIKIEIDTQPPSGAVFDMKTLLFPIPFQVRIFSLPDLFAGKLHAIICRQWKNRVKGRDYYDLIWFVSQNVPCRFEYLKNKLVQTNKWDKKEKLTKKCLIEILKEQFKSVDFQKAKNDVRPFIKDQQELSLWSCDFFSKIVENII